MLSPSLSISNIWCNRLGLSVPVRKDRIGLSNLVDKAINLYEKHLITYEKLEYLLAFAELTPKEMRIERESTYQPAQPLSKIIRKSI